MFGQQKDWDTRENAFAAFTMGPLTDFWHQREEAEFTGVDKVPVPQITTGWWSFAPAASKAT